MSKRRLMMQIVMAWLVLKCPSGDVILDAVVLLVNKTNVCSLQVVGRDCTDLFISFLYVVNLLVLYGESLVQLIEYRTLCTVYWLVGFHCASANGNVMWNMFLV